MSEELQEADLAPAEDQNYEIDSEAVEVEAKEPEQATNEEPQKVVFNEEQQRIFNEQISKKTAKMREAERRAEELEQQLQEAKAQLPQEQRPHIPEWPDPYDDDYDTKVKARDEALRAAAAYDAKQEWQNQQARQLEQQKLQAQQQELQNTMAQYSQRAVTLGVDAENLRQAGSIVAGSGMSDGLARLILGDDKGPLITTYLAANPSELDELLNTNPYYIGSKLDQIKTNAESLRPKPSSAPPPVDTIQGNGVPEKMPANLEGAIFE